jgi:hypothetical protein
MTLGYVIIILAWIAYAVSSFYAPNNTGNVYHLSSINRLLLQASVAIPVLLIWLTAIRGAMSFKRYATLLANDIEAPAMNWIANGLIWLVAYIVLLALVGQLPAYAMHTSWQDMAIETKNHAPMVAAFIGFACLFQGSRKLQQVTPFSIQTNKTRWLLIGLSGASALFAVTFLGGYNAVTNQPRLIPAYAASPTILLFTLILPYIGAWFLGLLASLNIHYYARKVSGSLYRRALQDLVRGITGVITFITVLQILVLMGPSIATLGLGSILILLYCLLVLYGIGFWLVSQGAQRLARIEVVQ